MSSNIDAVFRELGIDSPERRRKFREWSGDELPAPRDRSGWTKLSSGTARREVVDDAELE